MEIPLREAKARLSALVSAVQNGERVVITKRVSQQSRSYDTAAVAELTLTNWQPRESSLVWPETESGGLRSSTIPRFAAASSDLTASCIEDAHAPRYVRSI